MSDGVYVTYQPDGELCEALLEWCAFWADPPTSLDDPRLAGYRVAEAAWSAPLADGALVCPICEEQVRRIRALVANLEGSA